MAFKKPKNILAKTGIAIVLFASIVGIFAPVKQVGAQHDPNNLPTTPPGTLGWRSFKTDQIKLGVDPFKPTNFFRVLVDKDGAVKDDAEAKNSSVKGEPIKVTTDVKLLSPDKLYISGYAGQLCITVGACLGSEGWDQFYVDQIFPTTKGIRGIGVGYTNEAADKVCTNGKVFSTNVSSCTYTNWAWAYTSNTIWPLYATAEANKAFPIEIVLNKANRDKYGINKASDTGEVNNLNVIPYVAYASYLVPGTTNDASFLGAKTNIKVKVYANTDAGRAAYLADKDKPPEDSDNTGGSGTATSGGPSGIAGILNMLVTAQVLIFTRVIYWVFANVLAPLIESLLMVRPYTDVFVEVIYLGWQLIRNLCNIFIIVVLLVIGLGTLFRIESYNYKYLLVKVVIAALLVNFSLVFGQAILGVADTVQNQFLPNSSNVIRALGSKLMVEPINLITKGEGVFASGDATTAGASFANIARPIFALILALGAFFSFVALAAFLVIRIVALWVLLLVSPIAYVANVLPITASFTKQWWQKFLKYAFMTPVLAFFLNLAAVFGTTILKDQANFSKLLSSQNVTGDISQFVYIAGSQILIILFILVGLKAAASSGTYGAAAVTNFAEKGIRKPFEWYGKAGLAGTKAVAERGFEAIQNKAGITLDPRILKKEGQKYFADQKDRRLLARKTRTLFGVDGAPQFGDAYTNFERYANWRGAKRAVWESKLGFRGTSYHSKKEHDAEERAHLLTDDELKNKKVESEKAAHEAATDKDTVEKLKAELEKLQAKQYHPDNPKYNSPAGQKMQTEIDSKKEILKEAEKKQTESQTTSDELIKALKHDKDIKEKRDISTWTEDDKKKAEEDLDTAEKRLAKVKRPDGFAPLAAHHHLLSDEKKKIEHIDESDILLQLYKDAVAQKDRYKAEAIMHKLAKDVNFNELLESKYGKNDYNTFVHHFMESFKKDFSLSTHEALESMSEISYINEGNAVYNLARAVKVDKHGHMSAYSEKEHNEIIAIQMKKVEPQAQARNFWRGAFVDEDATDGKKKFKLHDAGITVINESLAKGGGLRGVAERMQEYNRKAILTAIENEMKDPKTAREAVKKLWENSALITALRDGKAPAK